MSTTPKDLFQRYTSPPSPLHQAVQELARQEGWTPRWDGEQQKKSAGKKSGVVRGKRGALRHSLIQVAYLRLPPEYKKEPYSTHSITALKKEYLYLLGVGAVAKSPPTDDEVRSLLTSIDSFDDLKEVYFGLRSRSCEGPRPPISDKELDLWSNVVLAVADLPESDSKALRDVSCSTLKKSLIDMGIRSARRAQRSR